MRLKRIVYKKGAAPIKRCRWCHLEIDDNDYAQVEFTGICNEFIYHTRCAKELEGDRVDDEGNRIDIEVIYDQIY